MEETLGTHNLNPASILVKELNKEIRAAKNLHELQDIFKMSSSGFDAVCVATVGLTVRCSSSRVASSPKHA